MSGLDKVEHIDDSETDIENMDPFSDRRLSEVVAQMLDSDPNYDDRDNQDEADPFEDQYEIQTAFIDYNEEPKNKELFRGPLPSIEESDLEDAFACNNEACAFETEKQIVADNSKVYDDKNIPKQIENISTDRSENKQNEHSQNIKTIIGKRTETMFGVTLPQEDQEIEGRTKCRSETEFSAESEFKDLRCRWSVTSV